MQACPIEWKDDAHKLTKLYPRVADEADEEDVSDSGSFFNFFELADDPLDVSRDCRCYFYAAAG